MRLLDLPPAILSLVFSNLVCAVPTTTPTLLLRPRQIAPQLTTGPAFATSCSSAYRSYSSAYTSWSREHETVTNQTAVIGGTSISEVTYYANATTLCDGRPRVTVSPAIPLSTGYITYPHPASTTEVTPETIFYMYPSPSPNCSIAPTDCDPLWSAYVTSLSAWQAHNATRTASGTSQITAAPQTPPCMNQSQASSWASATESIYGCGLCTIFGQDVRLVYFPEPTTVSRDMCTSAPPTNALTHYGPGDVLTAYAGTEYGRNASFAPGVATATLGSNTFASGTAYISIASVWAENRCSSTIGAPVSNAILAMPSQSVLSLRYSQDHFQYFMSTDTQTGYPVSYADFNKPIPASAWVGQEQCEGPWDTWYCGVIYENDYRPQLAIPPEIRSLNPEWSGCQLWYGGLYDPPVALQPQASAAGPTWPGEHSEVQGTAAPSQTAQAPTSAPTALPDQTASRSDGSWTDGNGRPQPSETHGGQGERPGAAWNHIFTAEGQTWQASACAGNRACIDGSTLSSGGSPQTLGGGVVASYGSEGLQIAGTSTLFDQPQATSNDGGQGPSGPVQVNTIVIWTSTFRVGNDQISFTSSASPDSTGSSSTNGYAVGDGTDNAGSQAMSIVTVGVPNTIDTDTDGVATALTRAQTETTVVQDRPSTSSGDQAGVAAAATPSDTASVGSSFPAFDAQGSTSTLASSTASSVSVTAEGSQSTSGTSDVAARSWGLLVVAVVVVFSLCGR